MGALVFAFMAVRRRLQEEERRDAGAGAAPAGSYHFAFVTNNSSDFWNIGEKGLRKAREGLGREGRHVPPAQG